MYNTTHDEWFIMNTKLNTKERIMKKATPGNTYVYLQKTEEIETFKIRKNNSRNRSLCKHLKNKISDFDETAFWQTPVKSVKKETYGFWYNAKYYKKIQKYCDIGFKIVATGWANRHGVIVINM